VFAGLYPSKAVGAAAVDVPVGAATTNGWKLASPKRMEAKV
jgi:hypothetical protein